MLLIPFFSAAILAREWRWTEVPALVAAVATFAAKDPLVVLARQRWIWKQQRPETEAAKTWLLGTTLVLAVCGLLLAATWPIWTLAIVGTGAAAFSGVAVMVSVKNRQRSTLFQIASALALSSTSLAACLSATGAIQPWCWSLWALSAMQATAGILVVHARLDARIALRKPTPDQGTWRRPAMVAAGFLLVAALVAACARITANRLRVDRNSHAYTAKAMKATGHSGWVAALQIVTIQNALAENVPIGTASKLSFVKYRSTRPRQNSSSMTGTMTMSPNNRTARNATVWGALENAVNGLNPTRCPRLGYGIILSIKTHCAQTTTPTVTASIAPRDEG